MAGRIVRDDIEMLRHRAKLVEIAGDYTKMQRAGAQWKGRCPFHTEKSPSFQVEPTSNLFHCFGCGEGGDIFNFLMKIEGLDFTEAVEHLARRLGVQVRYEDMTAGQRQALGQRSQLVAVMSAALDFYKTALYDEDGAPARDYLKARGFGKEDAERFVLGYAPNRWDALSRHLEPSFDRRDLERAGLVATNPRGGMRDEFIGRLMFPIRDPSGDVIGFGGRVLPGLDYGDFEPPKYKNSRETPLYRKSHVLFGVYEGRADIVRTGTVLVCEGYTDVMALHQAGVRNAVATCGTAVGANHLRILARYANRVVLAFDADAAGVKAAERAWEEARKLGDEADLQLRVLILPEGRDPADVVGDEGEEGLRRRLSESVAVAPFVLRHHLAATDQSTPEGREAALKTALEVLGREPDLDLRREYARIEIAEPLGLSAEFVAKTAMRQGIELDRHEGAAVTSSGRDRTRRIAATNAERARLERRVLQVVLQRPALLPEEWYEVTPEDFTHPTAQGVHAAISAAGGAGVPLGTVLAESADDDIRAVVRAIALEDPGGEVTDRVAADLIRALLRPRAQADLAAVTEELDRVNASTDHDRWLELQRRVLELQGRLHGLQPIRD